MKNLPLILSLFLVLSCNENKKESHLETVDLAKVKTTSDSIANVSQQALLANVKTAIQKGGTVHAVDFCSEKAVALTDSLSQKFNVKIQRVSEKNRNANNVPSTENDKKILALYSELFNKKSPIKDTILKEGENLVYYKPINAGLPACIQCHGTPETDISKETLAKINEKYPNDKATGYKLNDLRGAWKLTWSK